MKPDTTKKRADILRCLTEGMSVRATARVVGCNTLTVLRVIENCGEACNAYQDENIRDVRCDFVEMDEIFSFVGDKSNEVWCWIALCAKTKMRLTWHLGGRSHEDARLFCRDVAKRIQGGSQITTDGLSSYRYNVVSAMPDCHFAQLVKIYTADNLTVKSVSKLPIHGDPMPEHISTSFIESSNLHMRMQNRRYARRTNAHSKKMANHAHMLAITFFFHNYARKHMTLKTTPAIAAGIETKVWTMEDVVRMTDAYFEDKANAEFERAFATKYATGLREPQYQPAARTRISL